MPLPAHAHAITKRHNAILRIIKAYKLTGSTVPSFPQNVRPDFFALDEQRKTVHIVDVAMPFENRYTAFEAARNEKRRKYADLA